MPITTDRVRSRFKMIVRSAIDLGDGWVEVTASFVDSDDVDSHEPERTSPDAQQGYRSYSEYAAATIGLSPWVFRTRETNRWVAGEEFTLDVRPTR